MAQIWMLAPLDPPPKLLEKRTEDSWCAHTKRERMGVQIRTPTEDHTNSQVPPGSAYSIGDVDSAAASPS